MLTINNQQPSICVASTEESIILVGLNNGLQYMPVCVELVDRSELESEIERCTSSSLVTGTRMILNV